MISFRSLELNIIVELSRLHLGEVRTINFENVNWNKLLNLILEHRIGGVVFPVLLKQNIPQNIRNHIEDRLYLHKVKMLSLYRDLNKIGKNSVKLGLEVCSFKGPLLSKQIYKDPAVRYSRDLDLFVNKDNLNETLENLQNLGFETQQKRTFTKKQKQVYLKTFNHYELYNSSSETLIELHWNFLSSLYFSSKVSRSFEKDCLPSELVGISRMNNINNFTYLIIHAGMHRWKRLMWAMDISMLVNNENEDFLVECYELSKKLDLDSFFIEGLFFVHHLLGVHIPHNILFKANKYKKYNILLNNIKWYLNDLENEIIPNNILKLFYRKVIRVFYNLQSEYLLGGTKMITRRVKSSFIQPKAWAVYSFPDSLFFMNYIAAPFLNVYRLIKKYF